jgi:hypothetical protein
MNRLRETAFRVWSVLAICALLWLALMAPTVAQAPAPQDPQPAAPSAPPSNWAEQAVDRMLARKRDDWAASMRAAIDSDPSTFAEARRLADVLKVNLDDAVKDFDFLRKVEIARRQADRELALSDPAWSRAFEDPEFASMSTGQRRPSDPDRYLLEQICVAGALAYLAFAASLWRHRRTRLMVFWQLLAPGMTWVIYPVLRDLLGGHEGQQRVAAVLCAASPTIVTLLLCLRDVILGSAKPADAPGAPAPSPASAPPPVIADGSDPAD